MLRALPPKLDGIGRDYAFECDARKCSLLCDGARALAAISATHVDAACRTGAPLRPVLLT
jgi:hypothetical protein